MNGLLKSPQTEIEQYLITLALVCYSTSNIMQFLPGCIICCISFGYFTSVSLSDITSTLER